MQSVNESHLSTDWPNLIEDILHWEKWTPETLSQKIIVPVDNISQWLSGSSEPSNEAMLRIEKIAQGLSIASLSGYVEIVRQSPYPMIIVDKRDNILVASTSSRLIAGRKLQDQMSEDIVDHYKQYLSQLSGSSFWTKGGQEHNFRFQARGRLVEAVVTIVHVSTGVYLVAQKKFF